MIFIPGNVPSSKNSKIKAANGIFNSKTVRKYLGGLGIKSYNKSNVSEYKRRPNLFKTYIGDYFENVEKPLLLGFHFVRDSRRKFDLNNMTQIICDLLVAHQYIEDDNMDCLIPIPFGMNGLWYSYDKDNPGVWLKKNVR